jgi:hypothetical protein
MLFVVEVKHVKKKIATNVRNVIIMVESLFLDKDLKVFLKRFFIKLSIPYIIIYAILS